MPDGPTVLVDLQSSPVSSPPSVSSSSLLRRREKLLPTSSSSLLHLVSFIQLSHLNFISISDSSLPRLSISVLPISLLHLRLHLPVLEPRPHHLRHQDSNTDNTRRLVISTFNDLSATLDFPSSKLSILLVRGNPCITWAVTKPTALKISTVHKILYASASYSNTKFIIELENDVVVHSPPPQSWCSAASFSSSARRSCFRRIL